MIRVFIGFDPRETVAYHVFAHSILARASQPVTIAPLMLSQLGGLLTRPRHALQSTDFSFSRFLVPHLCGFEGSALFFDCDMLMLDDVARLWALRDERFAVQVVKHHHVPKEQVKFLEQIYGRTVGPDDLVTVIRFSQIVEPPGAHFGNGETPHHN